MAAQTISVHSKVVVASPPPAGQLYVPTAPALSAFASHCTAQDGSEIEDNNVAPSAQSPSVPAAIMWSPNTTAAHSMLVVDVEEVEDVVDEVDVVDVVLVLVDVVLVVVVLGGGFLQTDTRSGSLLL
jgi:hypothetical protein